MEFSKALAKYLNANFGTDFGSHSKGLLIDKHYYAPLGDVLGLVVPSPCKQTHQGHVCAAMSAEADLLGGIIKQQLEDLCISHSHGIGIEVSTCKDGKSTKRSGRATV